MGIRRAKTKTEPAERPRVRLSGEDRLVDVARRLFHDDRILPLLMDLNPEVGAGRVPDGTVVNLPSMDEAQAFASQMGFSLGFDPEKGGATKAKRAWKKMQVGEGGAGAIAPEELAVVLHRQGLPPEQAARRLAALTEPAALERFQAASHDDEGVAAIAAAGRVQAARGQLRIDLKALAGLLDASARPAGRRALVEVGAADPDTAALVFEALLVPERIRAGLVEAATYLAPHLVRAQSLAGLDATLRDAELDAIPGEEGRELLRTLVLALVDRVELLTDERLALLGVAPVFAGLDRHTSQLGSMLRRLVDAVDTAPPEVVLALIDAAAQGSAPEVPKPWPVAGALLARLKDRLSAMHAGDQDRGLAGLIAPGGVRADVDGPTMSAAELAARAAANARVAEAHDGVPERLASTMTALFDPLRPAAPDTGSEAQQRQRRRSRIEKALLAPRETGADGAVVASVVDELLRLGGDLDDDAPGLKALRRRATKLPAPVRSGCLALAEELTEPIPALLRDASPVARALLVMALALDPEVGPTLARSSGREAALGLVRVHGTRAVTLAVQRYAEGPA